MKAIRIDQSKWSAQKNRMRKALDAKKANLKSILTEELRETSAFVAEELGARTFPSASAIGIAVAAMRFDMRRVYCTPGKAFEILESTTSKAIASRFYAAVKRGDIASARQILRNSGSPISSIEIGYRLDPTLREKVRSNKGRVMTAYPLQIVTSEEIEAETRIAIAEIGKTASGWFACAEKLGGDGNAIRWKGTAIHGYSNGSISISESDLGIHLTLQNHSPLASKHLSPGQVASILERGRHFLAARLRSRRAAA